MSKKLAPLEGQRGIAAIIVVVHHFILGFHPSLSGILPNTRTDYSIVGSPLFTVINGTGAVFYFFTLSGFVLSWGYFNSPNSRKLVWDALRRWPRLAGPTTIICALSAALFQTGAYYYREAGELSGSSWLKTFGGSSFYDTIPSFSTAIWQGLTTFVSGHYAMNTNLWTMVYEYYGSLIVFVLCPLFLKLKSRWLLVVAALLCAGSLAVNTFPQSLDKLGFKFVVPFIVGMTIAKLLSTSKAKFSLPTSAGMVALGLYFLGYYEPIDYYSWAAPITHVLSPKTVSIVIFSIGSGSIILATMGNTRLFLSMDNAFMRYLGRISFPIYLVHLLVLGSVSSWLYIEIFRSGGVALFATTLAFCIALSLPLAAFDEWWVKKVRLFFERAKQFSPAFSSSGPRK